MDEIENINDDKQKIVVKGRFKSKSMNLYGQFILFFNLDKQLEKFDAVISTYSDIYEIEPHTEWNIIQDFIAKTKWDGNFNKSMTHSIMSHFNKITDDSNYIYMLYDNIDNYDYENMDLMLIDIINRIITDKNLQIETGIQEVSLSEINKQNEQESIPTTTKEKKNNETESVILPVKAILSPVKGRPIYQLKIGHKIMVNVLPNNDKAKYFIDLMKLREEDKINPTPGEVIDIKVGPNKKDPIEILTDLGSGIFGKIIEDEKQVKLKIYDPSEYNKKISFTENKFPTEKKPFFSIGTIIMITILTILIGLLSIFLIKI